MLVYQRVAYFLDKLIFWPTEEVNSPTTWAFCRVNFASVNALLPVQIFYYIRVGIKRPYDCILCLFPFSSSGPQCLQLECVLSARFSGPLLIFPDRNVYNSTIRVRFGCLLFRTAACLSGPRYLQLEYVLGVFFEPLLLDVLRTR